MHNAHLRLINGQFRMKQFAATISGFTFWIDGDGRPKSRGVTDQFAAEKVAEVAAIVEQWLQGNEESPRRTHSAARVQPSCPPAQRPAVRTTSICEYCRAVFVSERQARNHVVETYVAVPNDLSVAALAKPLVRINGEILKRSAVDGSRDYWKETGTDHTHRLMIVMTSRLRDQKSTDKGNMTRHSPHA